MTTQELMFQILIVQKFSPELSEVGDDFVVWEIDCGWVGASNAGDFYLVGNKGDKYEVPATFHNDVNVRIAHFTAMLHFFDDLTKCHKGIHP